MLLEPTRENPAQRAEALVMEEQGGLASLQVRAVLPWSQALEILRLLADAQAGRDQNGAPH